MAGPQNTGGTAFPMQDPVAIHAYATARIAHMGGEPGEERERAYMAARAEAVGGMTLRQYAAIKLRVPNSGTDWLDKMIVEAKRDELAAMAMQSVLDGSWPDLHLKPKQHLSPIENSAVFAYEIADAMLKAGRQQ